MTFVNSGIGGQLVYTPEATWGVAPSLSSAQPLEFNTETLALTKNTVQGQGIHAGGMYGRSARRVITYYAAAGEVNMDLPTRYLNNLLKVMFGSTGSTQATLQSTSAVAGVASAAGMYLAAHSPIATNATTRGTGTSLTLQKGVPAVDGTAPRAFTYTGMKPTTWTLAVATGAIATLAVTFDGYNELNPYVTPSAQGDTLNASAPALATYTEAATNSIFHFREANLIQVTSTTTTAGITTPTLGATLGMVRSVQLQHQLNYDTSRYFLGGNGFKSEQIENNWRAISGQFVVDFTDAGTMYAAFNQDTNVALQLSFAGPSGSGSLLNILVPSIRLNGESPKIGGPGIIQATSTFVGLDNGVDAPIQAVYGTPDSA